MNHQYWLTKNAKKLQRKFNAKEDENIVHSDLELDSKLELFKSINESTTNLTNIAEKYKESLSTLSTETTNLGIFLKDCGKSSLSSKEVMTTSGKVINFLGQQHFTAMSGLTRTLQELTTFKRAVNDSKETIVKMEKERTEYRAALMLMKNCSTELDPDSGRGLEKFRTSQKYVKYAKQKFDKHSLACLQKIDLLSAARCNLFSYSLAAYQNNWITLSQKNQEVLETHLKIIENKPKRQHNFGILKELAQENETESGSKDEVQLNDKDQQLFFGEEFSDVPAESKSENLESNENNIKSVSDEAAKQDEKLIDYENFDEFMSAAANILMPSQLLMDDSFLSSNISMQANVDLLGSLLAPEQSALETSSTAAKESPSNQVQMNKNPSKKASDVSKWFHLFSELDPLNQQHEVNDANENMHAA